jgi:hypothetical protein
MTGIVLCNETLTASCGSCGLKVGHKPLCVINLRSLRSMAENIAADLRKLTERHAVLAGRLADVHEAVLAEYRTGHDHGGF